MTELRIPTKQENPDGLHKRYAVIVEDEFSDKFLEETTLDAYREFAMKAGYPGWEDLEEGCRQANFAMVRKVIEKVRGLEDREACYFVLRIDNEGTDPVHVSSSQVAAAIYCVTLVGDPRREPRHQQRAEELSDLAEKFAGEAAARHKASIPEPTRDEMLKAATKNLLSGKIGHPYVSKAAKDVLDEAAASIEKRLGLRVSFKFDEQAMKDLISSTACDDPECPGCSNIGDGFKGVVVITSREAV